MRYARLATASALLFSFSLIVACGGGGGGGGNAPVPPGVGGPGPTATPTPRPTATATATATPKGTATPSPTPKPTATPTPTPTPVPTATPTPNGTTTVQTGYGEINGTDDKFISSAPNQHNNAGEGDLEGTDPGALPQGGGQGAVVDNIPCQTSMSDDYHVHLFVGIMHNGHEVALPDAIGIVDPFGEFTDPSTGAPNQEIYGDCFYFAHTHDASGLVHLEAPSSWSGQPQCGAPTNWTVLCTESLFTLGNLLDIWGVSLTPTNFGPFTGPVGIYATPPQYWACSPGPCYRPSNQYQAVMNPADWQNIPLYMHTVIWIVIGTQPNQPASLPNIEWIGGGGS